MVYFYILAAACGINSPLSRIIGVDKNSSDWCYGLFFSLPRPAAEVSAFIARTTGIDKSMAAELTEGCFKPYFSEEWLAQQFEDRIRWFITEQGFTPLEAAQVVAERLRHSTSSIGTIATMQEAVNFMDSHLGPGTWRSCAVRFPPFVAYSADKLKNWQLIMITELFLDPLEAVELIAKQPRVRATRALLPPLAGGWEEEALTALSSVPCSACRTAQTASAQTSSSFCRLASSFRSSRRCSDRYSRSCARESCARPSGTYPWMSPWHRETGQNRYRIGNRRKDTSLRASFFTLRDLYVQRYNMTEKAFATEVVKPNVSFLSLLSQSADALKSRARFAERQLGRAPCMPLLQERLWPLLTGPPCAGVDALRCPQLLARRCSVTFARHVMAVKYLPNYKLSTSAAYSKPVLLKLILNNNRDTCTMGGLEREFEELVAASPQADEEGPYI